MCLWLYSHEPRMAYQRRTEVKLVVKNYRKDFDGKYLTYPEYGIVLFNLNKQPTLDILLGKRVIAIILLKKEKADD